MIEEKLEKIFKEVLQLNIKDVDESLKFIEMDIWDSMTFMFFITSLEDEFQISLTNDEILDIDCIRKTKEIIGTKVNN